MGIRKLQKEKRLPLHLIKRALDGDASAMPSDASAFPHLDSLIAARVGVDDALVLERVGAIKLVRRGKALHLGRIDAQLVGSWGDMRAAGYTEALGFHPDVCKPHVETATSLVHAELKIFLEHLEGRSLESPAADMAHAALNLLLSFFGLVRVRTVLEDLRSRSNRPSPAMPFHHRAKAGRSSLAGAGRPLTQAT